MNGRQILKVPRALLEHARNKLEWYLESRSQRQRLVIVILLLVLFATIDIYFVAKAISAQSSMPEIEHIQTIQNP